ncbi:unnamed protein product [Caenorhabditis auriculariae]|uniref:U6 small nuclear RNA (adenine-(43)-N(6))-methyltransferase n=1 Tax=Caenorhabditis auriculariae TaxID=2777116 RepID=A0A8S1GXP1_9PELO|nr:unnamed protein product [Caenorhabditis auriculariae]
MSLNRDMHPRNPYKGKPPNFKELALEFDEFRKHCSISNAGKVYVNFHEDSAIRALARVLLKKDFGLDVFFPVGTLVPRIPQRLNYILHIEDILKVNNVNDKVSGIDIGTGASCIYALLGAKMCGWRFLATDAEESSVNSAHENVSRNGLSDKVRVAHVDADSKFLLLDVVSKFADVTFDFCMCNPPFFESMEIENRFSLDSARGEDVYTNQKQREERTTAPRSATVASRGELGIEGGEVAFVSRIIDDSIVLRDRVKIYTSMLGRKQSLTPLRRRLERLVDVKFAVSTLNQGRTQRWILTWTFVPNFSVEPTPPRLNLTCPAPSLAWISQQMRDLEASEFRETNSSVVYECRRVTWTRQRARRRARAILAEPQLKRARWLNCDNGTQVSLGTGDGKDSFTEAGSFCICRRWPSAASEKNFDVEVQAYYPVEPNSNWLQTLRFRVTLAPSDGISMEKVNFELLSGAKTHLHQLLQHLRNSLASVGV